MHTCTWAAAELLGRFREAGSQVDHLAVGVPAEFEPVGVFAGPLAPVGQQTSGPDTEHPNRTNRAADDVVPLP